MAQTQLTYVIVKAGDTLESFAARYKSTVLKIARLNGLTKGSTLTPGQMLRVPKPLPDPEQQVMKQYITPRPRVPRFAFAAYTGKEGVYPGSEKVLVKERQEGLSGIFPLWFQTSPEQPWRLQSFATEATIRETVRKRQGAQCARAGDAHRSVLPGECGCTNAESSSHAGLFRSVNRYIESRPTCIWGLMGSFLIGLPWGMRIVNCIRPGWNAWGRNASSMG